MAFPPDPLQVDFEDDVDEVVAATTNAAHAAVNDIVTELVAHEADTSVHGIADTTVLATDAEVAAAVAAHAGLADPHPGYVTTAEGSALVTAHEGAANPHPTYETSAEAQAKVDTHAAAVDPHTGYRLESVAITAADVAADIATQAELDAHAAAGDPHAGYRLESAPVAQADVTNLVSDLALKAPLASPTLTGTPAAPTAAGGTNTTQIATTAFVKAAADAKVADAINDSTTDVAPSQNAVFDALALKANLAGGTFTGDISVPDEAYDATAWNGSVEVPTKNALRDKIESLGGGVSWPLDNTGATVGTDAITLDVTGDTQLRFVVNHNGILEWGPGNAALDVSFGRTGTPFSGLIISSGGRDITFSRLPNIVGSYCGAIIGSNGLELNGGNGPVGSVSSGATFQGFVVRGAASQSANLQEWWDSSGAVLFAVGPAGFLKWVSGKEQTTVGAAGGASALPATPTKFLQVKDSAGTTLVIPAYAAS